MVAFSSAIVSPPTVSVSVLSPSSSGDMIALVALDCVVSVVVYKDTIRLWLSKLYIMLKTISLLM